MWRIEHAKDRGAEVCSRPGGANSTPRPSRNSLAMAAGYARSKPFFGPVSSGREPDLLRRAASRRSAGQTKREFHASRVKFTRLRNLPAIVSRRLTANLGERRFCLGRDSLVSRKCPALIGVTNNSKPYRLRPNVREHFISLVEHIYESKHRYTQPVRLGAHPVRLAAHPMGAADGNALSGQGIGN